MLIHARRSIHLERKAPAFFATFKLLEFSKNDSNNVCTSQKNATNFLSFKGVAQKLHLPRPLEVQNSFGGKSILSQARDTKFVEKLKTHEYINW